MKTKLIYSLLTVLFLFSVASSYATNKINLNTPVQVKDERAIRMVQSFYSSYLKNTSNATDEKANKWLVNKYLTQELIAKVERMKAATDADPIIRAQDFDASLINTLKVKHLEGNWYMVSYAANSPTGKPIEIPLRVANIGGRYLIDYITPEWNGSKYGNSLLLEKASVQKVDTTSPLSFVKSFYKAYVMEYCKMSADLSVRLNKWREKYCTPNALQEIQVAAEKHQEEGNGYDLLIDTFDFDCLWLSSISTTPIDHSTYKVLYKKGDNMLVSVNIKIINKGSEYFIDHIFFN